MNMKFKGLPEEIVRGAVKTGDEEDLQEARRILAEIKSGKQKLYSQKDFEKIIGSQL
ncbi:MAG: hypothetical protein V1658_04405 [Candidatus Micrarchaeota archaeon]